MKPIPCPWNLREQAKKYLDAGVRLGIIQKVEQGGMQPSWFSPAIFVEKSDGGCRRVVIFKALNKQCSRDPNHIPDVLKLASQIPSRKDSKTQMLYFSGLDAWNVYHSIRLKDNATGYFGFSTEWGTFFFGWEPFGNIYICYIF